MITPEHKAQCFNDEVAGNFKKYCKGEFFGKSNNQQNGENLTIL